MTELHHIGIRVTDLDAAVQVFNTAFNVGVRFDTSSRDGLSQIAYVEFDNCRLELIADHRTGLSGSDAVIDHIAIGSSGIDADMDELTKRGFTSLDDAPRIAAFGNRVAAYDPSDFSGIKLHLVDEGDHG